MTQPTALAPAEALFLLKPNLTNGYQTIRIALLSLLAKGFLRIEETETPGIFRPRKVQHLRIRADHSRTAPPHIAALVELVRAAQADGGKIRDVVALAEKEFKSGCYGYIRRYIAPALVARGLIGERRFLGLLSYAATPAGKQERQRILTDIDRAREIPRLLKSNRERAVALALALGGTLLLADDLKKHYKQLAAAMASLGSEGGLDGGSFDTSSLDGGFDLGGFDLGGFDAGAFSALEAGLASFDAGFSDAGGGHSGGDGGGGHH